MSIREEIDNILTKDPAARSALEVVLCYPGFHAVMIHRVSRILYEEELFTAARWLSQMGRWFTGIEIHPGATIGKRVFIDHGMGVVIGETAEVGEDSVIYQGVTLGAGAAARKGAETRGMKRHPTLGKSVVVGSGAEIQGAVTVGDNVQVASGSIVLKDVPSNSIVVGVPGRVIYKDGKRISEQVVPDIEAEAIKSLKDRIADLERRLEKLARSAGIAEVDVTPPTGDGSMESAVEDPVDVFLHGAGI
jgi:serine O-acetyltransferase